VKDKEEKLRYLMHFAGMRPYAYYIGMCLADLVLFTIPIGLLMLVSLIMSIDAFYKEGGKMFLLLELFGFPFITLIYLSGFLFSGSEKAFKYSFLFLLGIMTVLGLICIPFNGFADYLPYIYPLSSLFVGM